MHRPPERAPARLVGAGGIGGPGVGKRPKGGGRVVGLEEGKEVGGIAAEPSGADPRSPTHQPIPPRLTSSSTASSTSGAASHLALRVTDAVPDT